MQMPVAADGRCRTPLVVPRDRGQATARLGRSPTKNLATAQAVPCARAHSVSLEERHVWASGRSHGWHVRALVLVERAWSGHVGRMRLLMYCRDRKQRRLLSRRRLPKPMAARAVVCQRDLQASRILAERGLRRPMQESRRSLLVLRPSKKLGLHPAAPRCLLSIAILPSADEVLFVSLSSGTIACSSIPYSPGLQRQSITHARSCIY